MPDDWLLKQRELNVQLGSADVSFSSFGVRITTSSSRLTGSWYIREKKCTPHKILAKIVGRISSFKKNELYSSDYRTVEVYTVRNFNQLQQTGSMSWYRMYVRRMNAQINSSQPRKNTSAWYLVLPVVLSKIIQISHQSSILLKSSSSISLSFATFGISTMSRIHDNRSWPKLKTMKMFNKPTFMHIGDEKKASPLAAIV